MATNFQVGDRVVLRLQVSNPNSSPAGEVCNSFYTTVKKAHDDLPVQWDDGSRSYVAPADLDYEYV